MLEGGGTVVVTDSSDSEYWIGYMADTPGLVGAFPSSYVELQDASRSSSNGSQSGEVFLEPEPEPKPEPAPEPQPQPQPHPQPVPRQARCMALFDYAAEAATDLSMSEGDVVVVTDQSDRDWWRGHLEARPAAGGFFPATFVQAVEGELGPFGGPGGGENGTREDDV